MCSMLEGPPPTLKADSGRQPAAARRQARQQAGSQTITFARHPLVPLPLRLLATFMILTTTFMITFTPTTVHDELQGDRSESCATNAVCNGFRSRYATLAHPNLSVKFSSWVSVITPCIIHAARLELQSQYEKVRNCSCQHLCLANGSKTTAVSFKGGSSAREKGNCSPVAAFGNCVSRKRPRGRDPAQRTADTTDGPVVKVVPHGSHIDYDNLL